MIYDASGLALPLTLRTDLCVIGSGAGGAAVAMAAAERGLSVLVLEAGAFLPPERMNQREELMLPALLYANGGQTTVDKGVHVHQGRAVGGSTVHNVNLCKRIPAPILEDWRRTRGLEHLPPARWDALYDEVEDLLAVSAVPEARWSRHNRILQQGCETLGWAGGGLSHNRTGCTESGFCLLGCRYDAKNNATKVMLPWAIAAGAQILSHCRAVRLVHRRGRVREVQAVAVDPRTRQPVGRITVEADQVCVAGSATGTAALLLRSKVPDPGGETGNTLRIHPALVAAGRFAEPVNAWKGIPQTYECTEFLDFEAVHGRGEAPVGSRTWIITAFAHPVGTATMMPGRGAAHAQMLSHYDHLGVLTNMIHDLTAGKVRPKGDLGWSIDYWPNAADRAELIFGLAASVRLLFAGGAEQVFVPTDPALVLGPDDDLSAVEALQLRPGLLDITAVHPMGSVPMGDDPSVAPVDSRGKHHHVDGLWVGDGSLFPSSIGGPPQLSIYAMGLHVGRAIADAAG